MTLRPNDYDRNGDIIPDSVREWAGCGEKLCKYCEDYDDCRFAPNDLVKEDVFTRKEELSKEESEWLIDFITKEDN